MKNTILIMIVSCSLYSCQLKENHKDSTTGNSVITEGVIERENISYKVLYALSTLELNSLTDYIIADQGLTISSYKGGKYKFSKDVIKTYSKSDTTKYYWGAYDGSGDDINLTLRDYVNGIYDEDFLNVKNIDVVKALQSNKSFFSNNYDNILTEHPNCFIKSFHYPFDEWKIIDVVMTSYEGNWYLIEIRKRCWTI